MLLRALWYNTYQTNVQRSDERMNRYEQRRRRVLDSTGRLVQLQTLYYRAERFVCQIDLN